MITFLAWPGPSLYPRSPNLQYQSSCRFKSSISLLNHTAILHSTIYLSINFTPSQASNTHLVVIPFSFSFTWSFLQTLDNRLHNNNNPSRQRPSLGFWDSHSMTTIGWWLSAHQFWSFLHTDLALLHQPTYVEDRDMDYNKTPMI